VAHIAEEEKGTREGILRPKYETEEDRSGETAVLASLCRRWGCSAKKLSDRYELDYLLLKKRRGKAWLEGYTRLDDLKRFHVSIGGRTDREDFQDIEPVAYIPTQDFVWLKE